MPSANKSDLNIFRSGRFECLETNVKALVRDNFDVPKSTTVNIDYGWIVNIAPNDRGILHNHPTYPLVAVYYVNTKVGCGDLVLHGKNLVRLTPSDDSLVIFPGSIYHHIEPNLSNYTRTSIGMHITY